MYSTLEQPAVSRHLPPVWEVLRAVSGLVGIVALLAIVAGISLAGESHSPTTVVPSLPARDAEAVRTPPAAPVTAPSSADTFVLYFVETAEQEQIAVWGEAEAATRSNGTPSRHYGVVSTEAALELAVQDVLKYSLAKGKPLQIEVVDMRELAPWGASWQ
jgi:hypothetical protein